MGLVRLEINWAQLLSRNKPRPSPPLLPAPPAIIDRERERSHAQTSERGGGRPRVLQKMIPQQWSPPCGKECTNKYAMLTQIPWRVFCKKGCDADAETWEECLEECNELCYKDPVLKDRQWSAYIDRSPGAAGHSEECFRACVSGCGYKFDIPSEEVDRVRPNRPPKPPPVPKPIRPPVDPNVTAEDVLSTSA